MDRDKQTDRQTDRQTAKFSYEMSIMWETKPEWTPLKTCRPLMATAGHDALNPASCDDDHQEEDDDDDDDDDDDLFNLLSVGDCFTSSNSDISQLVRFLWTKDRPFAKASTCTTRNTDKRHVHITGGIRTRNPINAVAADPRFRQRGQWARPTVSC